MLNRLHRSSSSLAVVVLLCSVVVIGCKGSEASAPEPPACEHKTLAELEAAYVAESVQACKGHESRAACPAMPAIEAKYAQKREEWVRCR